jgi:amino acid permease
MTASPANQSPYATSIGLVYVFNLIIGTGALALPKAFSDAGWATGVILLIVSAFIRYF